ncbi:MAG: serine/threonine protein kinase, partial [Actinotalea sp.]|nr:serine/threonine protein kinase [Actinotalea sp.]
MRPDTDVALGGRYRLVSRIAVGGMGEVWVGHDEALARNVAVKVLREEFAGDAGFLERFRAEARNSAQLSHPNIAQLYDYGEQDGSGFLVMELVLGEPMSDLLDRQPVLPTRRLLPILAQTARALHAAHVAGVVHRDVKPGNILLARSGRVKITDFGISTASNQIPMTASGMVMGTAQYLSPEQAIGRAATPQSDIYSLGIVAYESLVGNRPFTGPTAVDIAVAHVNTPVPPLPTDIDEQLSALIMRMLDKEPGGRPRSAASLARTLDDMLDRTPPGGVPNAYGRHARAIDVLHGMHTRDAEGAAAGRASGGSGSGGAWAATSGPLAFSGTFAQQIAPGASPATGTGASGGGLVAGPTTGGAVAGVVSGAAGGGGSAATAGPATGGVRPAAPGGSAAPAVARVAGPPAGMAAPEVTSGELGSPSPPTVVSGRTLDEAAPVVPSAG